MRGDIMLFTFVTNLVTKTEHLLRTVRLKERKENLAMIRAYSNVMFCLKFR